MVSSSFVTLHLCLISTLVTLSSPLVAKETGEIGGFCGWEAARYTLNQLMLTTDTDDVKKLKSIRVASLKDLRGAFESIGLRVETYESEQASDGEWSSLNEFVQTGNAVVLVLTSRSSESKVGHYFALGDVNEQRLLLMDPLTRVVSSRQLAGGSSNPIKSHLVVIYHPDSNFFSLPVSKHLLWFGLPIVFLLLTSRQLYKLSRRILMDRFNHTACCCVLIALTSGCDRPNRLELAGQEQVLGTFNLGDDVEAEF